MKLAVLLAVALAVVACAKLAPPDPPSSDYPCTPRGHSCGNHMCCFNSEDCCDGTHCPAGMCQARGNDLIFEAAAVGRVQPQFAERH